MGERGLLHKRGYRPNGDTAQSTNDHKYPCPRPVCFLLQVFDAADKEVSDEEVGKKGVKKPASDAKDPAEAMGDMLSSFFGGGKK